MIPSFIFVLIVILWTISREWLLQRQVHHVAKHRNQVPDAYSSVVSLAEHKKSADYTIAKASVSRWTILLDGLLLLGWTLGGGIESLQLWISNWTQSPLASGTALIFGAVLISTVLSIPVSLYRTFVIEARFGFNNSTLTALIADWLKGFVIAALLGVPLIASLLWLIAQTGTLWWVWASALLIGVSLVAGWLFPALIAPLFNRFEPLKDERLNNRIQQLLSDSGFRSSGVFVMDGSKRSGHGNAYFTGFGHSKRIVFYDTLLDNLTHDQIIAVLAHELGHFHHKHILKRLVLSTLTTLAGFALMAWLMQQPAFYQSLGVATPSTAAALLLFVMASEPFMYFLNPIGSWFSRRDEFQADSYAAKKSKASDLIDALLVLYRKNAATLTPDPLYSTVYDSHPPASQRIRHLQSCASRS